MAATSYLRGRMDLIIAIAIMAINLSVQLNSRPSNSSATNIHMSPQIPDLHLLKFWGTISAINFDGKDKFT